MQHDQKRATPLRLPSRDTEETKKSVGWGKSSFRAYLATPSLDAGSDLRVKHERAVMIVLYDDELTGPAYGGLQPEGSVTDRAFILVSDRKGI